MRRLIALAVGMVGCPGPNIVRELLPPDVETAVVIEGPKAWVVARGGPELRFEDDGEPVTVLQYTRSAAELALRSEAGVLVQAKSVDAPEDKWPLPPATRGARLEEGEFLPITDAAELASRAALIRVPATSCGELSIVEAHPLGIDLRRARMDTLASIGARAVLTSVRSSLATGERPRAFFLTGGTSHEIVFDHVLDVDARLLAFADGDELRLVELSLVTVTTYRVGLDGTLEERGEVPWPYRFLGDVVSFPGSPALFAVESNAKELVRLDTSDGTLTVVHRFAGVPSAPQCITVSDQQPFFLEGPENGVVGFVHLRPHRFAPIGEPAPIVTGVDLGAPCQSAYVRFPSGAELVLHTVGLGAGGVPDVRSAWRLTPADEWIDQPFAPPLHQVIVRGDHVVAIDGFVDDVIALGYEPRRPDIRPRACARAGLGNVREISFDGRMGFALQNHDASEPVDVVRFELF